SSGVIEHDISTIRKDAEITSLKSQIDQLKSEISSSQKTIRAGKKHDLRKIITKNTPKETSPNEGARTELVRKYGELYSTLRLETLDELDRLPQLVNSDELKNKLLFSVVVVSAIISNMFRAT
ncbi:Putative LOC100162944, partial [Caligus rogercresseyi]